MNLSAAYVALAIVSEFQSAPSTNELPENWREISSLFEEVFDRHLTQSDTGKAIAVLELWNLVSLIDDPYAGSSIKVFRSRLQDVAKFIPDQHKSVLRSVQVGGSKLLKRVFANPDFWSDLEAFPQDVEQNAPIGLSIPASDRIVSLNHNQSQTIERPLDALITSLEADNGIPDNPGLRERLLGQVRAGRELIRAGEFRAYLLYVTLARGLLELAERYKDHMIGAAAGKLVELLIEHIFKGS